MKIHAPGLAGRLAIVTTLLVTFAVAAVSFYGVKTLRDLAENEALTRVALAASAAREAVRQSTADLASAARVLAERPTLQRLIRARQDAELVPYLMRYCEGAELDACAVVRGGRVLAASDGALNWAQILGAVAEQGEHFLTTGAAPGMAVSGAAAVLRGGGTAVPGAELGTETNQPARGDSAAQFAEGDVRVLVVRRMDAAFEKRLGERTGLQIQVLDYAAFRPGEGVLAVLNSDALARDAPVAAYVPALQAYAAGVPLHSATGATVALLHALLPAAQVMDPVDTLTRRILAVAVFVAALAITGGILIGRHWIAGVRRLTDAARRLGWGDLATSIPVSGGKELALLGDTMEEMRRNLVDLTGELRRREAEAQAVLGGIVEGVYAVDGARRIRFLNPQAERLLKISAADALGRFCGDVLRPERDAQGRRPCDYACPIVRARRHGTAEAVERIEPVPGYARRVVIASAAPSDSVQVQVLRDETELEAVRKTRDTVLANISHEFRTPLAAQIASIELLRDGVGHLPARAQRELVSSLERGAHRLTWLIDNLLESVRVESDQLAIRRQDVALADVVQSARELIEPLIEQRGQRLEVLPLDDLPVIRGDRQRLIQVFVNLLANANKFGPPGSTIRIGGEPLGSRGAAIWVEDEGPGPTNPEDIGLFERFRRSGGEDPQESGLGLGLYIVRSIIDRHGGRVRLLRTPESRTRAQVDLPEEANRYPGAAAKSAARESAGAESQP